MKNTPIIFTIIILTILLSCQQNDYYLDGGTSNQSIEQQNLNTYDLLSQNKDQKFDSLLKVINLTNSRDIVNQPNITLFANTNSSIINFQRELAVSDRQIIPLDQIGIDTLTMLLKRFIVVNNEISLNDIIPNKVINTYDLNNDSLTIYGSGGTLEVNSNTPNTAYRLQYLHIKIPKVDTTSYLGYIQTHNLRSSNAIIHVLEDGSNFACGLNIIN